MQKRFSQACENNKLPILEQLQQFFAPSRHVLEIGSGTGQHSVFFAQALPHLIWQTSDVPENHPSILAWGEDSNLDNQASLSNWRSPLTLTIGVDPWPDAGALFDAVFSANTAHIMQPDEAKLMMQMVAENLTKNGVFCQYGPFKFDGEFTSQSNLEFDQHLRLQGFGGYRDINELTQWASTSEHSLQLTHVIDMPANNHLLVWLKA
ncbi:DUF938 domain-containing protein [Paraneptunicella aestuarii]|uniref:DUF938 domain-containing protein n=1 Tax=Paraneptunicella aestuarii TaxID=2831148 RepID=UPI001E3CC7C5|nr:DUF938 domain-containing protein [Paraneptunicella aestuarii]UAA37945.1 DUF938 domain-containing protein [Paraneptunicella aestuarii]